MSIARMGRIHSSETTRPEILRKQREEKGDSDVGVARNRSWLTFVPLCQNGNRPTTPTGIGVHVPDVHFRHLATIALRSRRW
jgi:hypothetical protein